MSKKVCVLIATHERIEITTKTIELLRLQTVLPKIVLVVSEQHEFDYYSNKFKDIYIHIASNQPLGYKWQSGVDFAKQLDISALVIQGSDDVLSTKFIEQVEFNLKNSIDFIGLQRWWIYNLLNKILYHFDYTPPKFPLGSARYYSTYMLNKLQWKIFDCSRNSCLDDLGWNQVKLTNNYKLIRETFVNKMEILAVKGDWKVMNKIEETLTHPNARLRNQYEGDKALEILKEKFNYEPT